MVKCDSASSSGMRDTREWGCVAEAVESVDNRALSFHLVSNRSFITT